MKKSISRAILTHCLENVDDGIALYQQLKTDNVKAYNFSEEDQLNKVGYALINAGKVVDAIKIFQLLIAEFPNSANPYDSLAETYLALGNKEQAIEFYQKALAVDPQYALAKNARKVLKNLKSES